MDKNEKQSCAIKTSVGGQALLEGIMMKGPYKSAMAVRKPNGEIDLSTWETKQLTGIRKVPFVRGTFNFIDTLIKGYECLMKSAEISGQEEEPDKFELWLNKTFGKAAGSVFSFLITLVAGVLAIGLFFGVPALITNLVSEYITNKVALSAIEGIIKIGLFLVYIIGVSNMKDIRRTFMYHGAEHKTIFAFEHGKELTVANIREEKRFHPRCGTSFIFVTIILSILISSIVSIAFPQLTASRPIWIATKVLMLPAIMGIGFEFIQLAGKYPNRFTKLLSAPGLLMQRITTVEPTDDIIEVAIEAMKAALTGEVPVKEEIAEENGEEEETSTPEE